MNPNSATMGSMRHNLLVVSLLIISVYTVYVLYYYAHLVHNEMKLCLMVSEFGFTALTEALILSSFQSEVSYNLLKSGYIINNRQVWH